MTPGDLSTKELDEFKAELGAHLQGLGLSFEGLCVEVDDAQDLLQVSLRLCSDSVIGNLDPAQCTVDFFARLYCYGVNIEGPVIFGGFNHSMSKESCYFFPIPEEYGDRVSLCVDWEFHPETLHCGYGSVRDRESLHHVHIQPSADLMAFIKAFSLIAQKWGIEHSITE
jgi:hypothetical protein